MTRRTERWDAARRLILGLALAGLLTVAAGCGRDGEPSATVTETVTVTAEPSAPESSEEGSEEPSESEAPDVDLSAPPTTVAEAQAHFDAAEARGDVRQELSRFEAPSGNLYCVLDSEFSAPACELAQGAVPDAEVCGDAPSSNVGRIEVDGGTPTALCNTDTIREPGAPVLGYGGIASWEGVPVECLVEGIGVTCLDTEAGTGFFLARGIYQLF